MREKTNEYLTDENLKKRLRIVFYKFQIRGEFEDFYHDYVIHILEGHGQHQLLDHFAIDFIRKELGRNGQKYKIKNALELNAESMDSVADISIASPEYIRQIKDLSEMHSGRTRTIIILAYVYCFQREEIAHLLGVSPSRISQIITSARSGGTDYGNFALTPEEEIADLTGEVVRLKNLLQKKNMSFN